MKILCSIIVLCQCLVWSLPMGPCEYGGRATKYTVAYSGTIPQGTCGFGPVASSMPQMFRDGNVMAPNEDFYLGLPAGTGASLQGGSVRDRLNLICSATDCSMNRCGTCWEVYGPQGVRTLMVADICDLGPSGDSLCTGFPTQFDVNTNGANPWYDIFEYGAGSIPMVFRPVSCPVTGNIGIYFKNFQRNNNCGGCVDYIRVTPFNYRIGIKKLEIQENGGPWVELTREWTNGYPKTGVTTFPIRFRVTSIRDEVISTDDIPMATPNPGVIVYTTGQFAEVPEGFGGSNTSSCQWLPELNVYTDGFGGVERTKWQGLAGGSGSWGCNPDFASTSGCNGGSGTCVAVNTNSNSAGMQFFYGAKFNPETLLSSIEFYASVASGAPYNGLSVQFGDSSDNLCASVRVTPAIGTTWTKVSAPVSSCPGPTSFIKFIISGNPNGLKIDDVRLIPKVCVPNCTNKACGSDGCGGFCGACTSGQTCNSNGQCVTSGSSTISTSSTSTTQRTSTRSTSAQITSTGSTSAQITSTGSATSQVASTTSQVASTGSSTEGDSVSFANKIAATFQLIIFTLTVFLA